MDLCFSKRELSWLDDLMPESKKKKLDDAKKKAKEEEVRVVGPAVPLGVLPWGAWEVSCQQGPARLGWAPLSVQGGSCSWLSFSFGVDHRLPSLSTAQSRLTSRIGTWVCSYYQTRRQSVGVSGTLGYGVNFRCCHGQHL